MVSFGPVDVITMGSSRRLHGTVFFEDNRSRRWLSTVKYPEFLGAE